MQVTLSWACEQNFPRLLWTKDYFKYRISSVLNCPTLATPPFINQSYLPPSTPQTPRSRHQFRPFLFFYFSSDIPMLIQIVSHSSKFLFSSPLWLKCFEIVTKKFLLWSQLRNFSPVTWCSKWRMRWTIIISVADLEEGPGRPGPGRFILD